MTKSTLFLCLLGLSASTSYAQQKPPLDHSVFDAWKSISNNNISSSGKYIFYTITAQEGDAVTELKNNKNQLLLTVPRGVNSKLTDNEQFFINVIKPYYKDIREARIKKKKPEEMPKDSLSIFNIIKNEQTKLGAIKSYKTAYYANNYIAYVQELEVPEKTNAANIESKEGDTKKAKPKKESVLILQQLATGDTTQFWKADNYYFEPSEKFLVFNKKTDDKDKSGVDGLYLYQLASKSLKKISTGKGIYKNITFSDKGDQLAFLADKSPAKTLVKDFKLYHYTFDQDTATVIVDKAINTMPKNWYVSGDGTINFNSKGDRLFFGLAPIPAVKDTTLVDFEHAKVDIWHWKDEYLMTQQLANVRRDMSKSYEAVYNLTHKNLVSLIDDSFSRVFFTDQANEDWALATASTLDQKIASQWQAYQAQDVYLVNINTGEKTLIKNNWTGQTFLSPDAGYIVLYDAEKANWYSYHIASKEEHLLNANVTVSFQNEEHDMPSLPNSYGIAGWSSDNKGIYINDRYDIWYFSLDGKQARNITEAYGRKNATTLRLLNLPEKDPRKRTTLLDAKQIQFLTSYNEKTKENGFFSLQLHKKGGLKEIIQDKYTFKRLQTSDDRKYLLYSKENFENSADLYLSSNFKNESKLTDINPQQKNYNWGTAELVKWTTPSGDQAEGILYKPENFDPNKKYPIIAYFYEKLTQGLYSYHEPAPTPSRLMIPFFVSNEYLVFAPDIKYRTGAPGKAAEEYINSGMRYLAQNAWVDETKMGIQGQSWGGYQVAHLITRTDMYAAAWTGAPVVNMTSAYGGIRWTTGMSRQFQYEKTQSRLGATLWENKDLYIENSPLFFLDRVKTPVAIMHNDQDGAVPWYQGIEMFTALRRLQKPAWLLNYNGDDHNLVQRQNRKDIQKRQQQFFDHFLKGKPAAEWIKSGIPAIKKGINWGFSEEK